jgi:hypothetical protein
VPIEMKSPRHRHSAIRGMLLDLNAHDLGPPWSSRSCIECRHCNAANHRRAAGMSGSPCFTKACRDRGHPEPNGSFHGPLRPSSKCHNRDGTRKDAGAAGWHRSPCPACS